MNLSRRYLLGGARHAGLFVALGLGAALAGCAMWQSPSQDQQTLDGLTGIQTDAGKLFGQLEKPAPDCLYANNAAAFDTLAADISTLKAHADSVANDKHTSTGLADLGDSLTHFRAADQAGGASCLPAKLVSNQQSAMADAVNSLLSYEQKKPKGA